MLAEAGWMDLPLPVLPKQTGQSAAGLQLTPCPPLLWTTHRSESSVISIKDSPKISSAVTELQSLPTQRQSLHAASSVGFS